MFRSAWWLLQKCRVALKITACPIHCFIYNNVYLLRGFLVAQMVKNQPAMQETRVWFLGQEDPREKGMATHSSILAWRIPWTEEPGRLQSMGSQRVRHDWATFTTTTNLLIPNSKPACLAFLLWWPTVCFLCQHVYFCFISKFICITF